LTHTMPNKPKSQANQSHPDPHKDGRDQYKRHVDGDITIRGQIETHSPPSAAEEHKAEREEDKARAKKNYIVSVVTLIAVIVYAGITFWQGTLTRQSINNNTQQFQIEQRPYVWYLEHILPEDVRIVEGEQMRINFDWVNYGKTPALKSGGLGKIFCGPEAAQKVEKWFSLLGDGTKPIVASSGPDRQFVIPPVIVTDPRNPLTYSSMRSDEILTQGDVDYILKTEDACFVGIRTQYFDAYGTRYWSDICLARQVNGVLAHCDSHNEMH
jgi:hypothetical protein